MKFHALSLLALSLLAVSCGGNKADVKSAADKNTAKTQNMFSKSGHKCTFTDATGGSKDVFISDNEVATGRSVTFHDFRDNGKITFIGASVNEYTLLTFNLAATTVGEFAVMQGRAPIVPVNLESPADPKEIVSGRLTLTEFTDGILEKETLRLEDDGTSTTTHEEIGRLQNCVKSTEKWG